MYYAKYIKYKNKYLNLKYQLGGTFDSPLIKNSSLRNTTIPYEVSTTLEQIETIKLSLKNNLVGLKVLYTNSILLVPFVKYNNIPECKDNPIYFYRYTDIKDNSYILCSLYSNVKIFEVLQKKNVRIQKINIDEYGNISLSIRNISIPNPSNQFNIENVINKLIYDLVGIKILETKTALLKNLIDNLNKFNNLSKIYYYRYTDENHKIYILCSLFSYYEFLDILYEHIEIEEVKININEEEVNITLVEADDKTFINRIYHIIPKPVSKHHQTIPSHIENTEIGILLSDLIRALSSNLFIITNNEEYLSSICMYNLFIGTVHVFVKYDKDTPNGYFLLSLFTQNELGKYISDLPANIKLYECRLYKQGDKIEFILNKNMVAMMFCTYMSIRESGYHKIRYYRGDSAIDNKFLNELDPTLLEKCRECISVKDIAFNTTLWLLPDKIGAKDHKDILEMEKDFLNNKFELINNNEKIQSWRYNFEDLNQLWEYSLGDLRKEVDKFKKELFGLEPCHKELLVLKLNEKGFEGDTMEEILQKSALCYLDNDEEDKKKRLLYQHPVHKDESMDFVKKCKFIPEMKKLLLDSDKNNLEIELNKYRQTILFKGIGSDYEKKFMENRKYFFANSWYWENLFLNITYDKTFKPFEWSAKINKLTFQCLALRDMIIFPIRIINIDHIKYALSYEFYLEKQEFCGFFKTNFIDNYNGIKKFNEECKDKFYFIYRYTDNKENFSGKDYRLYYYTGNSIWFEISMLPYYQVCLSEINWIYYTFIIKYEDLPHFYEFNNKKEIVVSRFSLDQIRCKYEANSYDVCELEELKEVYYNYKFYKREKITDTIFIENSLFASKEKQREYIDDVIKIRVK